MAEETKTTNEVKTSAPLDLTSMLMGWLVGRAVASQRGKQKEPVAYLYGHVARDGETPTHTIDGVDYVGAVLPPLPKSDLPYVYIANVYRPVRETHWFCFSDKEMYSKNDGFAYTPTGAYLSCYDLIDGAWAFDDAFVWEYTEEESRYNASNIIWASYDILNTDGTLYLAASDPIPVYA